jgi:hypothetical protein
MNHPETNAALAAETIRRRVEDARGSRLARLARCCRPSAWLKIVRRTLALAQGPTCGSRSTGACRC